MPYTSRFGNMQVADEPYYKSEGGVANGVATLDGSGLVPLSQLPVSSIAYNTIQDAGTPVTQRNIINFQGSGVIVADDPINSRTDVTIAGSTGASTYYMNESVTEAPYKEFSSIPTIALEQDVPTTIGAGLTSVIGAFQTPSGVPNTTNIPSGLWQFFLHLYSGASTDDFDVYVEVYKRDTLGTETLLFTSDTEIITNMSTTTTMYLCDGVFPATTLLTTDRIVVKVVATNTGSGSQTIHFVTEGSQHYSVATTTLNQVVPTGAVTSVSASSPLASSGGTTPNITITQASAIANGYLSSTDWSTFNGKQDAITLTTTGTSGASTFVGNTLNIPVYATGLSYFTEAQSTTSPNNVVYVDSFTAIGSATNIDLALIPKGTGAFMLAIPDSGILGGNKRGANAIDLQTTRTNANQVASGNNSVVIGANSRASSNQGVAIGTSATASGVGVALNSNGDVTGSNATASGTGSFAINGGQASGLWSFAMGRAVASNTNAFAFGAYYTGATASGEGSVAIGGNTASSFGAVAIGGQGNLASGFMSYAFGNYTSTNGIIGRQSRGYALTPVQGETQKSEFFLSKRTTDATATTLTVNGGVANTTNQVILSNNSAYRFKGTIIGKQSGSTNVASWDVDGLIVRGANASATSLLIANVNLVQNTPAWGTPTLTADTTNGGVQIQVTGAGATNIQWTCVIDTTEVIYA